jgi:hypothetical protein
MSVGLAQYETHFRLVVRQFKNWKVIPFLGAGVNLCGRPSGTQWARDHFLPSGGELTDHLVESFTYPEGEPKDLLRVSQFASIELGMRELYEDLRLIFNNDYPPTVLHDFLARLPATLRAKGYPRGQFLVVTTNYDDVLEQAFRAAGEPFDMVSYIADGEHQGKFRHTPPGSADPVVVENPNEYKGLLMDARDNPRTDWNIILKIHGAVDRVDKDRDSYVITEDHYIDYLTQTNVTNLLPVPIPAKLKESHFLFLGYSLSDWNLRVILRRIWRNQKLSSKSWAVEVRRKPLDEEFWKKRDVDFVNADLKEYISELDARVRALPPVGGGA